MRLDRRLHRIRLVKSRTLAQDLIGVALPLGGRVRVIEVVALPIRRGPPTEARLAYREIDEKAPTT